MDNENLQNAESETAEEYKAPEPNNYRPLGEPPPGGPPKKSKAPLIILLVIAAIAAAAFVMKDKLQYMFLSDQERVMRAVENSYEEVSGNFTSKFKSPKNFAAKSSLVSISLKNDLLGPLLSQSVGGMDLSDILLLCYDDKSAKRFAGEISLSGKKIVGVYSSNEEGAITLGERAFLIDPKTFGDDLNNSEIFSGSAEAFEGMDISYSKVVSASNADGTDAVEQTTLDFVNSINYVKTTEKITLNEKSYDAEIYASTVTKAEINDFLKKMTELSPSVNAENMGEIESDVNVRLAVYNQKLIAAEFSLAVKPESKLRIAFNDPQKPSASISISFKSDIDDFEVIITDTSKSANSVGYLLTVKSAGIETAYVTIEVDNSKTEDNAFFTFKDLTGVTGLAGDIAITGNYAATDDSVEIVLKSVSASSMSFPLGLTISAKTENGSSLVYPTTAEEKFFELSYDELYTYFEEALE
jgi:hypothetical protein